MFYDKKFSIPPKLDAVYENFVCITETASYRVFQAQTKQNPHEKHSIRILDPTKDPIENNFDSAATLFIQELFHLHTRCPGSVLINTLEISEDRKQIACAIRHYSLVTPQLQENEGSIDLKNPKVIEKLLNDVISDVEFLWRDLKMKKIASIMEPENIYYFKEKGTFFLGNWDKITEENPETTQDLTSVVIDSVTSELRSQVIAAEIKALAFALLKMKKVDVEELEEMQSMKKIKKSTYNSAVKSAVEEAFNDSQKLQNLVEKMLNLDPQNLPNLEEFKIKEVRSEVGLEESKINLTSNPVIIDSPLISTPPTLLAWCSYKNNKISIIDLETKQNYVTFDGAQCNKDGYDAWTHAKGIPSTKLLVSIHHNRQKSANIEIFDISEKGKANKIYSLGEVSGMVGKGDVTYNSRRSILGAIPVGQKIAYHLFNVDAKTSNHDNIVKLDRKSKWHSQYSTQKDNSITGFDFNPAGESIGTIDTYGVCLISTVNTDTYDFHLQVGSGEDRWSRCRWSTNTDEPFFFVKYDLNELNILDVEKKVLTLSNPVDLSERAVFWIDVCQNNANLLVSGGGDKAIKIFDKRESKIVKSFEGIHLGEIYCVRWNPSGDMIASASWDKTAKLLDFKTGKVLHTGNTPDGNWATAACFI